MLRNGRQSAGGGLGAGNTKKRIIMQIILIQDVNNLGGANEVVTVKNGYARNFLIPSKMAIEASPSNMKQLEERLKQIKKKEDAMLAQINKVIEVLKESPVKVGAKVGTSGKIFGSVTTVQIARAIRDQKGFEIDRRKINLLDEIKELGTFKAKVDFGGGNEADFDVEVGAE
jgi:large subunit ribosomal protein L9